MVATLAPKPSAIADPDWARQIVEHLERGLLVMTPALDRILFANAAGAAALRTLGARAGEVPIPLVSALSRMTQLPARRFTPAVTMDTPLARRFYVRARRIARFGAVLVTLAPAVRQSQELHELLHQRFGLSRSQCELIALVRAGLRNVDIASRLNLRPGTVKQYLSTIFEMVEVRCRTQLVAVIEQLRTSAEDLN